MVAKYAAHLRNEGYLFKPNINKEDLHASTKPREDLVKWHSTIKERR